MFGNVTLLFIFAADIHRRQREREDAKFFERTSFSRPDRCLSRSFRHSTYTIRHGAPEEEHIRCGTREHHYTRDHALEHERGRELAEAREARALCLCAAAFLHRRGAACGAACGARPHTSQPTFPLTHTTSREAAAGTQPLCSSHGDPRPHKAAGRQRARGDQGEQVRAALWVACTFALQARVRQRGELSLPHHTTTTPPPTHTTTPTQSKGLRTTSAAASPSTPRCTSTSSSSSSGARATSC